MSDAALLDSIAARLRTLRARAGLTQAQLGEMAGVSAQMLSHIERSENWPSIPQLAAIASALRVPVSYFFAEATEGQRERIAHILEALTPADEELAMALLDTILRTRSSQD
ncbi:MAG: helix-turn-helix domain-containing protein [Actinomycetota bacterium]